MWNLRIAGRAILIGFWGMAGVLRFLVQAPWFALRTKDKPTREVVGQLAARIFRLYLERLGASYIKLGQILSSRPDLLPEHVIVELQLLQDHVPPFPFSHAQETIEKALGRPLEEIFVTLDPIPIASASVAQVHRGELHTGEVVAVKVRRPHIIEQVQLDEAMMHLFAKVIALIPTFALLAPVEVVDEFCHAIRKQLDFNLEAENNRRFTKNFAQDEQVFFPKLYPEWCTEDVLTMEFIEGEKETDLERINVDRSALARLGVSTVLKMIFEHGFVHADLHPGNIIFQPGPRVTFIDLGLVAQLEDPQREALAELFFHITQNNGPEVARIMFRMSPTQELVHYDKFEQDITDFIAEFYTKSLGEVQVSLLVSDVFRLVRRHQIRCQPDYTLVNVAILVMEGLGKQLDPTMDLFEQAQPFLAQHLFSLAQQQKLPTSQPASQAH